MKEYEAILRLFKGVMVREGDTYINAPSEKALKQGVFISNGFPDIVIDEAIKQYGRNGEEANQTFHKSLYKVATEDMIKLYYEQLLHYFTTYGAEELGVYDADNVFVPKEKLEIPELEVDTELIVIKPITKSELQERIKGLITVNLALSTQTVRDIVLLSDYIDINEYSDGDSYFGKVKNKEVKTALCGKYGILPKRGDEFLRYFLAKACDKTLLIKDEITERSIAWVDTEMVLDLLTRYEKQYGLKPLAMVYNRFKPLFLSMKRHEKDAIYFHYTDKERKQMKEVNKIINVIAKMSKKYHKAMQDNDLNNFIKWLDKAYFKENFEELVKAKLDEAGIFTTIKIANYLNNLYYNDLDYKLYKVRNGKIFVKDDADKPKVPIHYVNLVDNIIKGYLHERVKGKTFYIPENVEYKLPQSEKQYVGNIPFGTRIRVNKQPLLVGIHWCNMNDNRGNEHRVDLDLHLTSPKYEIGWNSSYRDDDSLLLFTGDNTDAPLPKGASEFMYIDNRVEDTLFSMKLNNYTRDIGPIKYEIIIGVANPEARRTYDRSFIIDPNDIIMKIPMEMELGKAEQVIGVLDIKDDHIDMIFTDLTTSNSRASRNKEFEKKVRDYTRTQSDAQLSLGHMLSQAGAVRMTTNKTTTNVPYVLDEDLKLIPMEEADEKGIVYTGDDIYFKKVEVPVDYDFSLEALTKDSFINLLSDGIKGE